MCHYTPGCSAASSAQGDWEQANVVLGDWEVCAWDKILVSQCAVAVKTPFLGGGLFQQEEEKKTSSLFCWTSKGNGVKLSSISAAGSRCISSAQLQLPPSNVPHKAERGRRGRKEKDLFLPQTNKQTNKGGLGLAVSCPLGLLICSVCLLAVILIVAFCALIWIRLVVIILLLHLLAGDIESNN